MALDVARFQKELFLNSFQDAESNLPSNLKTLFQEIKSEIIDDKNKRFWSHPPSKSISMLYDLNEALAECLVFGQQQNNLKKNLIIISSFSLSQQNFVRKLKPRLSTIKDNLVTLRQKGEEQSPSSWAPVSFPTGRHTCFSDEESKLVGLANHEKGILQILSNKGFKAIGVHGMCGSGKTALVRKVLSNPSVLNKYKPIIWVCLSELFLKKELDIKIVKYILEEHLDYDVDRLTCKRSNAWFLEELNRLLRSKRYLIMLDDVWHCNDWIGKLGYEFGEASCDNPFEDRFTHALPKDSGGAVIVTSRIRQVAKEIVGEENLIHVKPLEEDDAKLLEVLVGESMAKSDEITVDEVVRHCHGLPFAAMALRNVIGE
ncbi:hypothetical protein L6164_012998 [Bauhinia variegata]|uniref:Uncharacterized protein n=1 Tax=Bauhinia variegata TaxID=167791 RepID=A0ACB9PBS8_BAUVA|nr:hypothetical protein L6164_012998 [Bauhinia variegata]